MTSHFGTLLNSTSLVKKTAAICTGSWNKVSCLNRVNSEMTVFCLKQGQGFEALGGGKPLPKLPLSVLPLPPPPTAVVINVNSMQYKDLGTRSLLA